MKLEPLLRVKAKENQRLSDGKGKQKSADLKAEPIETRQELAKAAGVSHDTIARGKVIQAKASEAIRMPPGVPVARFWRLTRIDDTIPGDGVSYAVAGCPWPVAKQL